LTESDFDTKSYFKNGDHDLHPLGQRSLLHAAASASCPLATEHMWRHWLTVCTTVPDP